MQQSVGCDRDVTPDEEKVYFPEYLCLCVTLLYLCIVVFITPICTVTSSLLLWLLGTFPDPCKHGNRPFVGRHNLTCSP